MDTSGLSGAGYQEVDGEAAAAANRGWWSATAGAYLVEHGAFLGDADFCWCPEGLRESEAEMLGPLDRLRGLQVLEVGAGAAQCSRWLRSRGVEVLATDVAEGMLARSAELDERTGIAVPTVCADARELPLPDRSFDLAFSAFGAIPFLPDAGAVHTEVARVLRPGGQWVFSVTHPIRWAFPDDPTTAGLRVVRSYFDRTPYVETGPAGEPAYAEFHHTLSDHVGALVRAGFVVTGLVEPEWPADNSNVWGGWGPDRGALLPGTMIVQAELRTPGVQLRR